MSQELIQQMHAEDGCDGEKLAECIQQLRNQRDGARYALEAERTAIIDGVNGIVKEIDSRAWIANSRGPYEWNDDRYRQEFTDAGRAIFGALEPLRKIGSDLSNCPRTTRQVIEARTVAALQAHVAALRAALERAIRALQFADTPEARMYHFADLVQQLQSALAATPEQSLAALRNEAAAEAWKPIETAPKDREAVLLWCPERKNIHKCWWRDGAWQRNNDTLIEEPTHWQPMPAPPPEST